jgi:hypothetical protein
MNERKGEGIVLIEIINEYNRIDIDIESISNGIKLTRIRWIRLMMEV